MCGTGCNESCPGKEVEKLLQRILGWGRTYVVSLPSPLLTAVGESSRPWAAPYLSPTQGHFPQVLPYCLNWVLWIYWGVSSRRSTFVQWFIDITYRTSRIQWQPFQCLEMTLNEVKKQTTVLGSITCRMVSPGWQLWGPGWGNSLQLLLYKEWCDLQMEASASILSFRKTNIHSK